MPRYFQRTLFRPTPVPTHAVALGARSSGVYRVKKGFREWEGLRHFVSLFWTLEGEGTVLHDGGEYKLPAGSLLVYHPGRVSHMYNRSSTPWQYYWWTLDGPLALPTVNALGLGDAKILLAGAPPVALFRKLHRCVSNITHEGELEASAVAFALLCAATAGAARVKGAPNLLDAEREAFKKTTLDCLHRNWNDSRFGVEQLADAVGLHRSVLTRRFGAAFGCSPSEYLYRWRIQNALTLLRETRRSVHEIARDCGWDDPNYFSRCIRKSTGLSPQAFRGE